MFLVFVSLQYWNRNALRQLRLKVFHAEHSVLHTWVSLIVFSGCVQGFVYKRTYEKIGFLNY